MPLINRPTRNALYPSIIRPKVRIFPGDTPHILINGQSLSIGYQTSSSDTTNYPGFMFSNGVNAGTSLNRNGTDTAVVLNAQPDALRTVAEACAKSFNALSGLQCFFSGAGEQGYAYYQLKKGTVPYASALTQINRVSKALEKVGRVPLPKLYAMIFVHGESDILTPFYYEYLSQLLTDYRSDSGNPNLKLFYCQGQSWTKFNSVTIPYAGSIMGALQRHEVDPTNFILVTPKYFMTYQDGVHLNAAGQDRLGEYYAYVLYKVLVQGQGWSPVRPTAISASGSGSNYTITATFNVPDSGNLVLDTTNVSNPGNYGFEVLDANHAACTVSGVSVSGQTLTITTTAGIPAILRYAYTGTLNALAGPTTGPRGNLRSDTTVPSNFGYTNYHWCVTFDKAINNSSPASTPSSPATTNLVGYWDASNGVTASSNKVSNWAARYTAETSTPAFVQATTASQFTLTTSQINSLPALVGGSSSKMLATLAATASCTGMAVFMVLKIPSNASQFNYPLCGAASALSSASASGNAWVAAYRAGNSSTQGFDAFLTRWRGSDTGSNNTYKLPLDTWFLYAFRVKGGVLELYANGKLVCSTTVASTTNAIDKLGLGADINAGNAGGQISFGAVAVYKDSLSDSDFWQTSRYLASTFALTNYGY